MLAPHFAADVPPPGVPSQRSPAQSKLVTLGTREWGAMTARIQELDGCARLLSPLKTDNPTLLVMLEEVGGHAEIRHHPDRSPPWAYHGKDHISFLPAGTDAWMNARDVRYLRQVVITFGDHGLIGPDCRLMFADKRVWWLASLLANEVVSDAPLDATYGESLGAAILTSLSAPSDDACMRSGLTARQLKRVTDYVRGNAFAKIQLSDMARLAGLSQSHFSRAFKIATGVPPHRWLLNFRVAESKRLLLETSLSLVEISLALGFCEQSHFTRAFSTITGMPPAVWRKSLKQNPPISR